MARVPKTEALSLPQLGKTLAGGSIGEVRAQEDREPVRRAQKDDKQAFEELVRRHQNRVFAVAGGILRSREDVEDIAQQVFLKAYFSIKRFDQRAAFSTSIERSRCSRQLINSSTCSRAAICSLVSGFPSDCSDDAW